MIKKIIYTTSLLSVLIHGQAQIKWPAVTPVTKPWTRWWWLGSAVDPKNLTANMQQYAEVGLGGLEITPIYGVAGYENKFVDYLSPQWMQLLTHTLNEAKRLNMQIDMATGSGWPFGGGPLIGDADACKDFVYKTWAVKAGETIKEPIAFEQQPYLNAIGNTLADLKNTFPNTSTAPAILKEAQQIKDADKLVEPVYANKNLQALAIDQLKYKKNLPLQVIMAYGDNNQTIDLTSKVDRSGKLTWTAPAGNWTVYALFMGWHGKMVERAAPGAEGNAIDHFSEAAIKKYLSRFDTAFVGNDLSHLRGFFNDSYEVDDARGQSNYTPGFFDEFKRRRGYDLKLYLPQLLAKQRDETSLRVLFDYRQTMADLLLEKFTVPWHNWAQAKGKIVRNQSHGSPANILDCYGVVDIPETEGTELLRFKFAASAAHILNKQLASAEAATWLNEHFKSNLGDVKNVIDKYFIGGVNHIVYHGTSYSPMNDPWPGWLFYAAVHFQPIHPFWKDFGTLNNYVTRCQSFLQSGKPDNDILLYFPFSDHNSEPGRDLLHHYDGMKGFEQTDFNKVAEDMLQKGYAFDFISDKQLEKVTAIGSLLHTPGGNYRTIVLANTKYLPLATLEKLVTLAKYGAKIIVYKNMPGGVPGFGQLETRQKHFTDITATLKFVSEGALQKATVGKGAFIKGEDLSALLTAASVNAEPMYGLGLQCIRRNISGGHYYFISNASTTAVSKWVPLNRKAASAILFDPMQEQSGIARTRIVNGVTEVFVQLQPGESCVLQTSNTILKGNAYRYYTPAGTASEIKGKWTLRFMIGGPDLPKTTTLTRLGSWTDVPEPMVKEFSGTAQYSIEFPKPAGTAPAYVLDLGKVAWSAEVVLNGKNLGTLLGPVYRVTIPASLLKADNELYINVTNGMTNRILDLEKQGVAWKKFYNVNFPSRLAENRGADGVFTAAKWEYETSGLLGPVTIAPLK
ncbi:glycoside hydrolase family 2 protein [Niastella caeni]|uniref:Glycoside hydrolase family 2 protein n=1 Tax=Niastella caeni TaxID=2569763 RepID=A0A4S8HLI7_9BACT|nr:glycosyl hydrolase [Niastella caeni]THU36053.1 glycoside hydrolase family 2 protein [Niastella caeni]